MYKLFLFLSVVVTISSSGATQQSDLFSQHFEQRKVDFESSNLDKQINQNKLIPLKKNYSGSHTVTLQGLSHQEEKREQKICSKLQVLCQAIEKDTEDIVQARQEIEKSIKESGEFLKDNKKKEEEYKRIYDQENEDWEKKHNQKKTTMWSLKRSLVVSSVIIAISATAQLTYWTFSLLYNKKTPRIPL